MKRSGPTQNYLLLFAAIDLLFGSILYFLILKDYYHVFDINPGLCITVDWWTIYRPFVFAGLWTVAWLATMVRSCHGYAATGVTLLIGLAVSMDIETGFYSLYLNYWIPELPKPFLFRFYGINEWDFVRALLLLVATFVWLRKCASEISPINSWVKNSWFRIHLLISFLAACLIQWRVRLMAFDSDVVGVPIPFYDSDGGGGMHPEIDILVLVLDLALITCLVMVVLGIVRYTIKFVYARSRLALS